MKKDQRHKPVQTIVIRDILLFEWSRGLDKTIKIWQNLLTASVVPVSTNWQASIPLNGMGTNALPSHFK